MENTQLSHIEERLGHVAVDMGLLNPDQVHDVQLRMLVSKAGGFHPSFGDIAIDLGYLNRSQFEALQAEENRRRRLISGYEIIDLIGTGTIATVYHARQVAMDRDVALKILHPRLAQDPVFVRAYIAEAQAVSRFHHPNIVQGIDVGQSNGFYYFAHEYLSGGSMSDRLRNGTAHFSENRLLMYLRQTTAALKHAWGVGVYHGDINPGNLLIDGEGNIKLANLGVPRVAGLVKNGQRSAHGFVRCGPEYAAPEQIANPEIVNAMTDIYNLAATFYHLSFGIPPFGGTDRTSILSFRDSNPMPLFTLKSQENFSGKYLRLLRDMLEVDPEKRPADPEDLESRLEKFHLADSNGLSVLARQGRQVSSPSETNPHSLRILIKATAPRPSCEGRKFSLKTRGDKIGLGRGMEWILAGLAIAAIVVASYFLTG